MEALFTLLFLTVTIGLLLAYERSEPKQLFLLSPDILIQRPIDHTYLYLDFLGLTNLLFSI